MKPPAIAATLDTLNVDLLLAMRWRGVPQNEAYFLDLAFASWDALVREGYLPGLRREDIAADLRAARALINVPQKWWPGAKRGGPCHYPERRCMLMALGEAISDSNNISRAESYLCAATGTQWLNVFNDNHTHAEVLAAYDRAIALAEKESV